MRPFPFSAGMLYTFTFWSVFALWILFEVINSRIRRSTDSSRARDRGSLQLVAFLWFAGIVLGFWFSFVLPQASILRLRQLAFFAGIILMLIGLALRQYSMKLLGQFFTFDVAIHAGHSLVEIGPYRYIRHPSYSGALLTMLGFGLALGNWAALAVALLCLAIAYAYRISVEEAALVAALGRSYQQYVSRTWRLVPFLF